MFLFKSAKLCLFVGWLVGGNSEPYLMPKGRHKVEGSRKCEQEVWRGKGRPKIWEKLFCVNKVSENGGIESQRANTEGKTQDKPLEKLWKCRGKVKMEHFRKEWLKL